MATEYAGSERTKKKLTAIDVFLIVGALLLLLAVVGQDIAVYALGRLERSERLEIGFLLRSVSSEDADDLLARRPMVDTMVIKLGDVEIGTIKGGLTVKKTGDESGKCIVQGIMASSGRSLDGVHVLAGTDQRVVEGARFYVTFEYEGENGSVSKPGFTMEVVSIDLLEN